LCDDDYSGFGCDTKVVPIAVEVNYTTPIAILSPNPSGPNPNPTATSTSTTSTSPSQGGVVNFGVAVKLLREISDDSTQPPVYEIDLSTVEFSYNNIVKDSVEVYSYYAVLVNNAAITVLLYIYNTTNTIEFANQSITISPNQIKMTISVDYWPFNSISNYFEVIVEAYAVDSNGVVNQQTACSNSRADSHNNIRAFTLSVGGYSFYGQFLSNALLDTHIRPLSIYYAQSGEAGEITLRSSAFFKHLEIDPNFAVLVNYNGGGATEQCNPFQTGPPSNPINKDIIIIAVVIPFVVVVVVIVVIVKVVIPRYHTWKSVKSDIRLSRLDPIATQNEYSS